MGATIHAVSGIRTRELWYRRAAVYHSAIVRTLEVAGQAWGFFCLAPGSKLRGPNLSICFVVRSNGGWLYGTLILKWLKNSVALYVRMLISRQVPPRYLKILIYLEYLLSNFSLWIFWHCVSKIDVFTLFLTDKIGKKKILRESQVL